MTISQVAAPVQTHANYERLIARAKQVPPATTVVVHPCDETSLRGVVEAAKAGIIIPILVGPTARIAAWRAQHGIDISRFELIDAPHSDEAAAQAVELIHEAKGELLMKGSLHTDELMRAVTASATGLRTARRISHVFVMDVPTYPETLFITDAAINIFPDLDAKRDIIQNAIDLFTQVGLGTPRVAILSAVETVTSKIPSTIEAAALCKMAERGQITGGVARRAARLRQRHRSRGGEDQGHPVAGRGPRADPGRARSRSRQHARQEPFVPGQGRRGRDRARGARTDHPHLAGRFRAHPHGLLRGGGPLCGRPTARHRLAGRVTNMETILVVNAGSSSLKFQVFAIGRARPEMPDQGPDRRHRHAAAAARPGGRQEAADRPGLCARPGGRPASRNSCAPPSPSTISSPASDCMPACWRRRSAASMPSCSPPGSARTRRRCGRASPTSSPARCRARSGGERDRTTLISRRNSRVALYVIPTDEELMIAQHTLSVLSRDAARASVSENVARRRFAL